MDTKRRSELKISAYHKYPGPRYKKQGPNSGEEFYETILQNFFKEAVEQNNNILIDLDDTAGYASSFLDEMIGNLVYDYTAAQVVERVSIKSDVEPYWLKFIFSEVIPLWEKKRIEGLPRKV